MSNANFVKIINACLIPLLNYMVIIWGSASRTKVEILNKCIRRTARFIHGKSSRDRISREIYHDLNWLMPRDNFNIKCLSFIYQVTKTRDMPYFENLIQPNSARHNYATRRSQDLHVPFQFRNEYGKKSILNQISVYNNLPNNINTVQNLKMFRKAIKNYVLNLRKEEFI